MKIGDLVKHKRQDTHLVGIVMKIYISPVRPGYHEYRVQWLPTRQGYTRCTAGVLEILNESV